DVHARRRRRAGKDHRYRHPLDLAGRSAPDQGAPEDRRWRNFRSRPAGSRCRDRHGASQVSASALQGPSAGRTRRRQVDAVPDPRLEVRQQAPLYGALKRPSRVQSDYCRVPVPSGIGDTAAGRMTTVLTLEQRTIRKVSWRLLPLIVVIYFVAYIDRTNLSFAPPAMKKGLGPHAPPFRWGGGIFFLRSLPVQVARTG